MRKGITPFTITVILFLLQLSIFLWLTLRPFAINPSNRASNMLYGQGAYTSFIRQAKEGAWTLYNAYTTRPTPSISIMLLYVFLGKIAAIFSFDPVFVYMIARVLGGLTLFLATYWFVTVVVPKKLQPVALLFALGVEPGPLVTAITSIRTISLAPPAIFSYYPQEIMQRHFGLPHHVLAEALGLFLLGNVFCIVKRWSWPRLAAICIIALIGTVMMPAYNSVLVLTVFAAWGLWALARKDSKRVVPAIVVIVLTMAAVALLTKTQMDLGYPWKNFNLDEKRWVTDPDLLMNYLSSLLLYLPGAIICWTWLAFAWRRVDTGMKLLAVLLTSWVFGPLLYIPISHMPLFPLANFRLIDGYAYVPMAILSTIGLYQLFGTGKKRWILGISLFLILSASLFLTVSYTRQEFALQQTFKLGENPLNTEWGAIRYLATTPKRSGVLVMQEFGEVIPSYASVRVFLGETPGYIDWDERYFEAVHFYSDSLSDSDASAMLKRENITYVWWGQAEKDFLPYPVQTLYPSVLVPVYQTLDVTIFRLK